MTPNGKKDHLLNSWKDIASHLGRGVRTCIRWEKQLGLPVRRLEKDARGKVFAYTHEIDAWLEQRAGHLARVPPSTRKLRWPWGALAVVLVAAVAALFFLGRRRAGGLPADFHIKESTLIVLDGEGSELWRFDTKLENLEPKRPTGAFPEEISGRGLFTSMALSHVSRHRRRRPGRNPLQPSNAGRPARRNAVLLWRGRPRKVAL